MSNLSDRLLESITSKLKTDSRVFAAWLSGSRGRGAADEFSDIDIWIAIEDQMMPVIVEDPLAFVHDFVPTVMHVIEPTIAPTGGAFVGSWVPVEDVFVQVDWYLTPADGAMREPNTDVIFGNIAVLEADLPPLMDSEDVDRSINDNLVLGLLMIGNLVKHANRDSCWKVAAHARHADDCLSQAEFYIRHRAKPDFDSVRRSFLPNRLPRNSGETYDLATTLLRGVDQIAAEAGMSEKLKDASDAMRATIRQSRR